MDKLLLLAIADVQPDPKQPRKDFDKDKLNELASSIKVAGVIQPITVRLSNEPDCCKYTIIYGERRWRASQIAGLVNIRAILVTNNAALTDDEVFKAQFLENSNSEELNKIEKAEYIQERIKQLELAGCDNAMTKVANDLGKSQSWLSKNLAVLKYPEDVRSLARTGLIRDYVILKKLASCSPEKRAIAIASIKTGDFNSKDFFSRRRTQDTIKNDSVSVEPGETPIVKEAVVKHHLTLSTNCVIKLMASTNYNDVLAAINPNWEQSSHNDIKEYLVGFKQWIAE